jgi:hypothetical protein
MTIFAITPYEESCLFFGILFIACIIMGLTYLAIWLDNREPLVSTESKLHKVKYGGSFYVKYCYSREYSFYIESSSGNQIGRLALTRHLGDGRIAVSMGDVDVFAFRPEIATQVQAFISRLEKQGWPENPDLN